MNKIVKNVLNNFADSNMTYLNGFFCTTHNLKAEDVQVAVNMTEKIQILTFESPEFGDVWHLC